MRHVTCPNRYVFRNWYDFWGPFELVHRKIEFYNKIPKCFKIVTFSLIDTLFFQQIVSIRVFVCHNKMWAQGPRTHILLPIFNSDQLYVESNPIFCGTVVIYTKSTVLNKAPRNLPYIVVYHEVGLPILVNNFQFAVHKSDWHRFREISPSTFDRILK